MRDTKLYSDSAEYYKEYLSQFQVFMDLCKGKINNNQYFEFISFKYNNGDKFGEMLAFGETHKIKFDFVIDKSDQFAILEVVTAHKTRPSNGETRLVRWYFDNLGNIKNSRDESFLMYSLSDTNFLNLFLNKTLENYFAYVKRLDKEAEVDEDSTSMS